MKTLWNNLSNAAKVFLLLTAASVIILVAGGILLGVQFDGFSIKPLAIILVCTGSLAGIIFAITLSVIICEDHQRGKLW